MFKKKKSITESTEEVKVDEVKVEEKKKCDSTCDEGIYHVFNSKFAIHSCVKSECEAKKLADEIGGTFKKVA